MKKNSLIIILTIIIVLLVSYIIYDKFFSNIKNTLKEENEVTLKDVITLPYVSIYLLSNSSIYLKVLDSEEIEKLDTNNYLKDRLNTLYDRAFLYDVYIDNIQLRGFKITLDSDISKMVLVTIDDYEYVVFIKNNNTIALFNYDEYYNLLYTTIYDNYNDYKNVADIKDNEIIYLDGSKEELKV